MKKKLVTPFYYFYNYYQFVEGNPKLESAAKAKG